jgi:hypothetical protein
MDDLHFKRFLESWHVNLPGPKTAGELLSYAEMYGLELNGETPRAKETALGKMLTAHAGAVIEHNGFRLIIERGKLNRGLVRYQVHHVEGA